MMFVENMAFMNKKGSRYMNITSIMNIIIV